ncbi:uncharacterized protein F5891DRAFT_434919 [Suillus fuscotomentosus]|uniref:Uncharacterized protein n=1 Tax=Suillus fuscotomentosus TaxID=1912939 RepID=A0AAD4HJP8_9AGAM|nr:uncharacterized protein F5891DRAFT_434919 [Suillus fuscotomentosus]KAG1899022.1 hypothetical protein F5891DRAFT_434919 [Suillus fuscotomentosus]
MSSSTERRSESADSRRTPTPPPVDEMPLAAFFAQFASFSFDEKQPSYQNFGRLVKVLKCDVKDHQKRIALAREGFNDALVHEFNVRFGIDQNDISNWQNLCGVLRIDPVPNSVKKCRKRVWDMHVNLVDLVDSQRTGKPVKLFASLEDLRTYTLQTRKIFPKETRAYQGGLLKELLREIKNTYFGRRGPGNGSAKKKERKKKQKAARAAAGGK